jgi:hypothetical protein
MVLKYLTGEQQMRERNWLEFPMRMLKEPNLLEKIVTGNETQVFKYDTETKFKTLQSTNPESQRPTNAGVSKSNNKCMLICFLISTELFIMNLFLQNSQPSIHYKVNSLEKYKIFGSTSGFCIITIHLPHSTFSMFLAKTQILVL